jgi:hypothetical protein
VFEEGDTVRPTMDLLRVTSRPRGTRVRVRVSEAGTLYVRIVRGRRAYASKRVRIKAGTASAYVRHPRRAGRYRLAVWVRDASGIESRWRYRTLRVGSQSP